MLRFLKVFGVCFILLVAFCFFGGILLFDFKHHFIRAIASIAFILAALLCLLYSMDVRIETLEKKLEELEKQQKPQE
ncbi:MAG: hypothetical protein HFG20_04015 [Anaerotruncus sp.]|nr:hypothetical protein [Anaerotruncus sp.]